MKLDLNCDLGEGEPSARTQALMRWITSANIACGGHAGDVESMHRCVRWAIRHRVRIGAHPGAAGSSGRGRGQVTLRAAELEPLLIAQLGALGQIARNHNAALHHVKLHGGLYHASESSLVLARAYVRIVRQHWPGLVIYALAHGSVARAARDAGVPCWAEGFADRGYRHDATLVPRGQPGALLKDPRRVVARVRRWIQDGRVDAADGRPLRLPIETLCVHADTPHAVAMVRALNSLLGAVKRSPRGRGRPGAGSDSIRV